MTIDKLKGRLAVFARKMAEDKLTIGHSGNISARYGRSFYIKAAGRIFENLKSRDFIGLNVKTPDIKKNKKSPSCEYRLHSACYLKRPDIKAVFHTHPFFAQIAFFRGVKARPITMEFAAYISHNITSIEFIPPGSCKLAQALSAACEKYDCIIMKKHGLVTLGKDMQDAYVKSLMIEREARARIISKLLRIKSSSFSRKQIVMLAPPIK